MHAATVLLAFSALASAADPPARPNILLIQADDLGFSDLGCYGGEIATPNLDALAKNGLRFRQFYNCARCCPTRASLITGLYPHQAGVGEMNADTGQPGYRGFPQPNTVTIAEVLKAAGYHTSIVGKWHLGGPKRPAPTDRGFDEFYGMIGGFNSCFQEDPFYTRLPTGRTKREYAKDAFYSTDVFGDYALDFLALARKEKKPFFQYFAFNAPHFPLQARPDDIKKNADSYAIGWDKVRGARHQKQIDLGLVRKATPVSPRSPYTTRSDFLRIAENPEWDTLETDLRADLARRMALYAAMVECMDRNIGRVIDDLRKHGEFDNRGARSAAARRMIRLKWSGRPRWCSRDRSPRTHSTRTKSQRNRLAPGDPTRVTRLLIAQSKSAVQSASCLMTAMPNLPSAIYSWTKLKKSWVTDAGAAALRKSISKVKVDR